MNTQRNLITFVIVSAAFMMLACSDNKEIDDVLRTLRGADATETEQAFTGMMTRRSETSTSAALAALTEAAKPTLTPVPSHTRTPAPTFTPTPLIVTAEKGQTAKMGNYSLTIIQTKIYGTLAVYIIELQNSSTTPLPISINDFTFVAGGKDYPANKRDSIYNDIVPPNSKTELLLGFPGAASTQNGSVVWVVPGGSGAKVILKT